MDSSMLCPPEAPMYGYLGAMCALVLSNIGAAYGGVQAFRVSSSSSKHRCTALVCCVLLEVFGILLAVLIQGNVVFPMNGYSQYSLLNAGVHLATGLLGGLSNLIAGVAIGHSIIIISQESSRTGNNEDPSSKAGKWVVSEAESEDEGRVGLLTNIITTTPRRSSRDERSSTCHSIIFAFSLGVVGFLVALIFSQNSYVCAEIS